MKPFKEYIQTFVQVEKISTSEDDPTFEYKYTVFQDPQNEKFWYGDHPMIGDQFNKEIVYPKVHEEHPNGLVAIRSDEDFWIEAVFPFEYKDTPVEEIVNTIWPDLEKPIEFFLDKHVRKEKDFDKPLPRPFKYWLRLYTSIGFYKRWFQLLPLRLNLVTYRMVTKEKTDYGRSVSIKKIWFWKKEFWEKEHDDRQVSDSKDGA